MEQDVNQVVEEPLRVVDANANVVDEIVAGPLTKSSSQEVRSCSLCSNRCSCCLKLGIRPGDNQMAVDSVEVIQDNVRCPQCASDLTLRPHLKGQGRGDCSGY
jgi:hypothetical protein